MTQAWVAGKGPDDFGLRSWRIIEDGEAVLLGVNANTVRDLGSRMLEAVMPPRCLRCSAIVAYKGALFSDCFDQISFITAPLCMRYHILLRLKRGP